MIVLPIEGMKQLLLELSQYEEIREEDTNTWVPYEVCINYGLDRDLMGIVAFHMSEFGCSAFLILIDFRFFHVYGSYEIVDSINLDIHTNIWFEDVGHFVYFDCCDEYNEVTESLLCFSKSLKSITPNDFSSYDYEDLMTGLIDRLVLYSRLPIVYSYLEVLHEGVMLETLRTNLITNINRLIELRQV